MEKVEKAEVFLPVGNTTNKKRLVGELSRLSSAQGVEYIFRYDDAYFADKNARSISLTLPKTQQEYRSDRLFSYFEGLVSEGLYKEMQVKILKIDENDPFKLLINTARYNTIDGTTFKVVKS